MYTQSVTLLKSFLVSPLRTQCQSTGRASMLTGSTNSRAPSCSRRAAVSLQVCMGYVLLQCVNNVNKTFLFSLPINYRNMLLCGMRANVNYLPPPQHCSRLHPREDEGRSSCPSPVQERVQPGSVLYWVMRRRTTWTTWTTSRTYEKFAACWRTMVVHWLNTFTYPGGQTDILNTGCSKGCCFSFKVKMRCLIPNIVWPCGKSPHEKTWGQAHATWCC